MVEEKYWRETRNLCFRLMVLSSRKLCSSSWKFMSHELGLYVTVLGRVLTCNIISYTIYQLIVLL